MLEDGSEDALARTTLASGIVALFVEALLFGAFCILYGTCTWILLLRNKPSGPARRDRLLFLGCTVMFLLATIHITLDVYIIIVSFVVKAGDMSDMAASFRYLTGLAAAVGGARFAVYITQTLIGDCLMIYRVYVVWNHNWRVAACPGILLAGEVVFGYFISFDAPAMMVSLQGRSYVNVLVKALFVVSVSTNLLSSGLIMRRVWQSHTSLKEYTANIEVPARSSIKWRVVESVLQSAAIYCVASISLAVTAFISPTIAFPACHSVFPSVIGIVFLSIVARIGLNTAPPGALSRSSMQTISNCSNVSNPTRRDVQGRTLRSPHSAHSLPIAIQVSVSSLSDVDSVSSLETEEASIAKVLSDAFESHERREAVY